MPIPVPLVDFTLLDRDFQLRAGQQRSERFDRTQDLREETILNRENGGKRVIYSIPAFLFARRLRITLNLVKILLIKFLIKNP